MTTRSISNELDKGQINFSIWRTLRLSSFQVGSAMGEILTASVWNRVMISELGMPATPVGLLLVLQYILLPISLWAGHRSDTIPLWGKRRTSYIWLGRGLMVIAFPLLGISVRRFEAGDNVMGWSLATVAFLLFGVGKLASGSVYLALVRDSAPANRRGIAIGIAETVLIAFFPIVAIGFGRYMEQYSEARFWQLSLATMIIGGFFWWFATVRSENEGDADTNRERLHLSNFSQTFNQIWSDVHTRAFFIFLATATFFAWMQDNILEPFGHDVFAYEAGTTTRFTGYWGGATIIVLIICFVVFRKQRPEDQSTITRIGLIIMGVGMAALAVTSIGTQASLLTIALLIFGGGFGLYTFGGLSLMIVMSPTKTAGIYLGLWTACILLSKGAGTLFGSILLDGVGGVVSAEITYGTIFFLSAIGLVVASTLVQRVDVPTFARDHT